MVSMPRDVRLLYIGLWNVADDHGWLPDDSEQIRMLVLPGDQDAEVASWVELLVACGRLERFETPEGDRVLHIAHWKDHQRVDHPGPSKIARENSRKLAIPQGVRRDVAIKYGCKPGGEVKTECYFCGAQGSVYWFKLSNGKPSGWVIFPDLELDHFQPEASGGKAVVDNIVLSCRSCNRSRCDKNAFDFLASLSDGPANPRESSRILAPDQGSGIREQGNRDQVPMEVEQVKRLAPQTTKERRPAGGIEEVKALFAAEGSTEAEALKFFHFYEANGWVQGKNKPLVQWRSAAKNWIANNTKNGHINGHNRHSTPSERRNAAIGDDPEWQAQVRARIESGVEGFGPEFEHSAPPQD